MRKTLIRDEGAVRAPDAGPWLDVEGLAAVEITSEAPEYPIEAALAGAGSGWRAAEAGPQRIRLLFDRPQAIQRVLLVFRETEVERTQEFTLSWAPDGDPGPPREIVRQQWNFSPGAATEEREEYHVKLAGAKVLELRIAPNISGGDDRASLALLRVA